MKPTRLLAFAAAALLAACGSDSSVAPTANTTVDLATAFSEMSIPGISAAATLAGGVATPSANSLPSGCSYAAASQSFVCPAVTSNGVTVTSSYSLFDAAGQPMWQFNASTVASLRVRNTIAGTITANGDVLTVDGQQDQTLSGLQSATHTLNGTTTMNLNGTRSSQPLPGPFSTRSTTTISNLVIPAHGSANSYPLSGTVAVDQATTLSGALSVSSRVVMTFNGTSKVGVALTVDGHALPGCTIDLANGTPSCG